jgi:hypothetical protein
MDSYIHYYGYFPTATAVAAWDVAATHAKRFDLALVESTDRDISYGVPDPNPTIALRREDGEWSHFGVFGLRPAFVDAVGTAEVVQWLLTISDDLRCYLVRSFSEETHPTPEEIVRGPDALDWLQYFPPDVAKRWSLPYLEQGPFHKVVGLPSGGVGIQLGPSPFEHWTGVQAAADYLGIRLRPRMVRSYRGELVERKWP